MTISFDRDAVDGILLCTVNGTVRLDELQAAAQTMWKLIGPKDARVLMDLVDARLDLRAEEIARLADFARRGSPGGGLRMVFLLSTDLEFGLVRMFKSLRDSEGTDIYVVRDRARAMELLNGDKADARPDRG